MLFAFIADPDPSPLVRLYTVLAVLAQAAAVLAALGWLLARRSPTWRHRLAPIRERIGGSALVLVTVVALVTVTGSLYLSERAQYDPCRLCWIQRGFMYPLLPVLAVAAWRDAVAVRRFVVPWALLGACVSVWHIYIEINPEAEVACDPENPCSLVWIRELGYVTIPVMALSAFALIVTLLALATRPDLDDDLVDEDVDDHRDDEDDEDADLDVVTDGDTGSPRRGAGTPTPR
jgi:disulfide bond formation protein DsbB